jgi:hypothetical protein
MVSTNEPIKARNVPSYGAGKMLLGKVYKHAVPTGLVARSQDISLPEEKLRTCRSKASQHTPKMFPPSITESR